MGEAFRIHVSGTLNSTVVETQRNKLDSSFLAPLLLKRLPLEALMFAYTRCVRNVHFEF